MTSDPRRAAAMCQAVASAAGVEWAGFSVGDPYRDVVLEGVARLEAVEGGGPGADGGGALGEVFVSCDSTDQKVELWAACSVKSPNTNRTWGKVGIQ